MLYKKDIRFYMRKEYIRYMTLYRQGMELFVLLFPAF